MSDHLTTVTAIYGAFGRGDIPAILERIADDVRWEAWDDNRRHYLDTAKHTAAAGRG